MIQKRLCDVADSYRPVAQYTYPGVCEPSSRGLVQQTVVDNRYALSELLGGAGMSKIHLAPDRLLVRDVALKVLREQYAESGTFLDRFERKAKAAACPAAPMPAPVPALGESPGGARRNQAVRRERLL